MNTGVQSEYIYTDPFGADELILKAFDERLYEAKKWNSSYELSIVQIPKTSYWF